MLLSMTGFGSADAQYKDKVYTVSIKSLNSKFSDLNIKIPNFLKEKEPEIRRIILQDLIRGKIELKISVEYNSIEEQSKVFNEDIILNYYNQIKQISDKNKIPMANDLMSSLIRLPDVITSSEDQLLEQEWLLVVNLLKQAIHDCISFRKSEGQSIQNDVVRNVDSISNLLLDVPKYENERIALVREKLNNGLKEISERVDVDRNRFEQEVVYYIEKYDINEEKQRLKKHCEYFLETLRDEDHAGKKLGFISQEIGREINTLGSKANHVEIQKIVVVMKDELEKIKEQLLNVL